MDRRKFLWTLPFAIPAMVAGAMLDQKRLVLESPPIKGGLSILGINNDGSLAEWSITIVGDGDLHIDKVDPNG